LVNYSEVRQAKSGPALQPHKVVVGCHPLDLALTRVKLQVGLAQHRKASRLFSRRRQQSIQQQVSRRKGLTPAHLTLVR